MNRAALISLIRSIHSFTAVFRRRSGHLRLVVRLRRFSIIIMHPTAEKRSHTTSLQFLTTTICYYHLEPLPGSALMLNRTQRSDCWTLSLHLQSLPEAAMHTRACYGHGWSPAPHDVVQAPKDSALCNSLTEKSANVGRSADHLRAFPL